MENVDNSEVNKDSMVVLAGIVAASYHQLSILTLCGVYVEIARSCDHMG